MPKRPVQSPGSGLRPRRVRRSAPTPSRPRPARVDGAERYRCIVTAMSEGVVLQDAAGRIIECNASAERILGLTRAEMLGLTSLDPRWQATDSSGRPVDGEAHPVRVTLRTGEPLRGVVMGVQRADGTRVWVSVNTQPLFYEGAAQPHAVVATFADITENLRAASILEESEARFRSLFEHSIDGILLTAPDGAILAANPEACRLLRRSETEICAAGRAGVVDLADPELPGLLRTRAETGKVTGELTLVRGDGTRFPAEFSSAVFTDRAGHLRTSLTFRDVSARKRAEAELWLANHRLEERVAERTRALSALLEISREVAAQLELGPLLTHILARLKSVIDYTGAAVAVREQDEIVILDYAGPAPRDQIVGARIALTHDSGYRRVVEQNTPVLVDDIWGDAAARDGAWPIWTEALVDEMSYARSWLGVPLVAKDELIGVLRLDHVEPGRFTAAHAGQVLAFAYQVAVAIVNAQLHQAAQYAAVAMERERLARDLHDSVSQSLFGISLGVHAVRSKLSPDMAGVQRDLDFVLLHARAALAEMRALIFELRPDSLARDGVISALERHVELLRARHRLEVVTAFPPEPDIQLAAKEAVYRIAQEATNNAAKHAGAQRVTIRLSCDANSLALEISDDGQGFDVGGSYPGHLGLHSMRERAEKIGGVLEVVSQYGSGTLVRLRAPCLPHEEA